MVYYIKGKWRWNHLKKAYKFRFYPTKTQIKKLNSVFGCVRYVYNHFLGLKQELYKTEKKSLSYSECSKELTVLKKEKDKCNNNTSA